MEQGGPEFKLVLSEMRPRISDIAQATIHLSELAESLALEERTLCEHIDDRPENVAEHSNMLAIVAPALAEQYYPELDANLVARYCPVHDAVEGYVGDTPTHIISEQGKRDKEILEKKGEAKLASDFRYLPGFVKLVQDYEAQIIPEARFVRVVDKCMPALIHFANKGKVLRTYNTAEGVLHNSAERAAELRQQYPEFEKIIALREELSRLMVDEFFNNDAQ